MVLKRLPVLWLTKCHFFILSKLKVILYSDTHKYKFDLRPESATSTGTSYSSSSSVGGMVNQGPQFNSQSAIPSPPVKINISTVTTGNQQIIPQPQIPPGQQQPVPPQAQPVPSQQQPPPPQQQPVPTQPTIAPAQPNMVGYQSVFSSRTCESRTSDRCLKTQLACVAAAPQLKSRCLTSPTISMFKPYWYIPGNSVFQAPENFNLKPSAPGTEFTDQDRLKKTTPKSDIKMNFRSYGHWGSKPDDSLQKCLHYFILSYSRRLNQSFQCQNSCKPMT